MKEYHMDARLSRHPACCVPGPKPESVDLWAIRGKTHVGALPAFPTKKARRAFFRSALRHQPRWAYRTLVIIFEHQTVEERASATTIQRNGVGFTGVDAEILTSLATQYLAKRRRYGATARLSLRQEALLLRRMPKYADQLLRILERRGVLTVTGASQVVA